MSTRSRSPTSALPPTPASLPAALDIPWPRRMSRHRSPRRRKASTLTTKMKGSNDDGRIKLLRGEDARGEPRAVKGFHGARRLPRAGFDHKVPVEPQPLPGLAD